MERVGTVEREDEEEEEEGEEKKKIVFLALEAYFHELLRCSDNSVIDKSFSLSPHRNQLSCPVCLCVPLESAQTPSREQDLFR